MEKTNDIDEVEITDEMLEAGVKKLYDYDPSFSNERDIVEAIFREMMVAYHLHSQECS